MIFTEDLFYIHIASNPELLIFLKMGIKEKCNREKPQSILLYKLKIKWENVMKFRVERFKELTVLKTINLCSKAFVRQCYHKHTLITIAFHQDTRLQVTPSHCIGCYNYLIYVQCAKFWVMIISDCYITEISPKGHFSRFLFLFSLKSWSIEVNTFLSY